MAFLDRSAFFLISFDGGTDSSWLACYLGRTTKQQRVALRKVCFSGNRKDRFHWALDRLRQAGQAFNVKQQLTNVRER
jgi:hypothetical protein